MASNGKLAGIHYSHEAGSHGGFVLTKAGKAKRRTLTVEDLESRSRVLEESQRVSDELRAKRTDENIIASLEERVGHGRDVLAYLAEMESRIVAARQPVPRNFYRETLAGELEAKRTRKPKRAPAASAKVVSAAQARDIATVALSLIGLSYPRTPAEAESLIAELSTEAVAA